MTTKVKDVAPNEIEQGIQEIKDGLAERLKELAPSSVLWADIHDVVRRIDMLVCARVSDILTKASSVSHQVDIGFHHEEPKE